MKKIEKRKKESFGITGWMVKHFWPEYHLAKNPPKGTKKTKKQKAEA